MSDKNKVAKSEEVIASKIFKVRGQNIMLDRDLADLFDVKTKALKQAVRRNINRFPEDFMFEMTKEELEIWRSQFVTSKSDKKGLRYAPFCFTEQGVTMLSCVLKSDRAISMNIQIIRIFVKLRQMLIAHKDILLKLEEMENRLSSHDDQIVVLFEHLKRLLEQNVAREEHSERKKIGFKKG